MPWTVRLRPAAPPRAVPDTQTQEATPPEFNKAWPFINRRRSWSTGTAGLMEEAGRGPSARSCGRCLLPAPPQTRSDHGQLAARRPARLHNGALQASVRPRRGENLREAAAW